MSENIQTSTQAGNTTDSSVTSGGDIANGDQAGLVDGQIQQLMSSPHYMDPHTNPKEHRRVVDAVQELYQQKSGDRVLDNETNMPGNQTVSDVAEAGNDAAFEQIQSDLVSEGRAEMDKLVEMGFERADISEQIWPHEVEALKAQRLLNTGNYAEAGAILKGALNDLAEAGVSDASSIASTKNLLDGFLSADFLDKRLKLDLGEQILTRIFRQQGDYCNELMSALDPDEKADPKARIQQIQGLLTPTLRKSNIRLYQQLLDEQTRLYQQVSPGYLESN